MKKSIKRQIEETLGVYWVAPHSSPSGVEFKKMRCGDCFCTIEKIHTHNEIGAEQVKEILQIIKTNQSQTKRR